MANKVGPLIKEARTKAGLSQESLARKVDGLTAGDLGKAERGEKELPQAALKAIAKATGVTQKSLLEAPFSAKKPAASSSSSAKKPAAGASAKKTEAKPAQSAAVELTAAEKSLLNAWRKADAETRKAALRLLKGEKDEPAAALDPDDLLGTLLSGAMDVLGNLGKK